MLCAMAMVANSSTATAESGITYIIRFIEVPPYSLHNSAQLNRRKGLGECLEPESEEGLCTKIRVWLPDVASCR